jgi:hypothetical protein
MIIERLQTLLDKAIFQEKSVYKKDYRRYEKSFLSGITCKRVSLGDMFVATEKLKKIRGSILLVSGYVNGDAEVPIVHNFYGKSFDNVVIIPTDLEKFMFLAYDKEGVLVGANEYQIGVNHILQIEFEDYFKEL